MLDNFTELLLKYLYSLNNKGEFELISLNEIETNIKTKDFSRNKLISSLNYLRDKDYIKLRYAEDDEICYAILTNANIYIESLNQSKNINKRNNKKFILRIIFTFLSAFLGGLCGALLMHFIF